MKDKKKILVIAAIVLCIVIIAIVLFFVLKKPGKTPGEIVENPYVPEIKNTTEIIEDGKIEITNFDIKYNSKDKRWYLSMNVNNSSKEKIDLKDYSLRLYHDNSELVVLPGTTLGIVSPKSSLTSVIALEERFSKTNYVEIFKNKKD